ncbi:MAG: hypothetical protein ACE5HI_20380 [bacterium]
MRSKRLRKRGQSFIKNQQEVKKKQFTWGKYFYLIVLCISVFMIIQWVYNKIFFVNGVGFLESETTFVEARTPGRIMAIKCNINDQVSAGEPLVMLGNVGSAHLINNKGLGLNGPYYTRERQIIDIESRINLLKQEINQSQEKIKILKEDFKRAGKLLAMNAITRPQFRNIEDKLKNSENELTLMGIKYNNAIRLLDTYKKQYYLSAFNRKVSQLKSTPPPNRSPLKVMT